MKESKKRLCRMATKQRTVCAKPAAPGSPFCWQHTRQAAWGMKKWGIVVGLLAALIGYYPGWKSLILPDRPLTLAETISRELEEYEAPETEEEVLPKAKHFHLLAEEALEHSDYKAFNAAFDGLLRVCDLAFRSGWGIHRSPTANDEIPADWVVELVLAAGRDFSLCIGLLHKLAEFAISGSAHTGFHYNNGTFFHETLYIETLKTMVRICEGFESGEHGNFGGTTATYVFRLGVAETHRLMDLGFDIEIDPNDVRAFHINGRRLADDGKPEELSSVHGAANVAAKLPWNHLKNLLEGYKSGKLSIHPVYRDGEDVPDYTAEELVTQCRYYCDAMIAAPVTDPEQIERELQPLLERHAERRAKAVELFKRLVWRERTVKEWCIRGLGDYVRAERNKK